MHEKELLLVPTKWRLLPGKDRFHSIRRLGWQIPASVPLEQLTDTKLHIPSLLRPDNLGFKVVLLNFLKKSMWKILKDVGKTFSLQGLNYSINPFVGKNRKLRNIIKKMLTGYKIWNLSTKRE